MNPQKPYRNAKRAELRLGRLGHAAPWGSMTSQPRLLHRLLTKEQYLTLISGLTGMCHTDTHSCVHTCRGPDQTHNHKRPSSSPEFPLPIHVHLRSSSLTVNPSLSYWSYSCWIFHHSRKTNINRKKGRNHSANMAAPLWARREDSLCFSMLLIQDGPRMKAESLLLQSLGGELHRHIHER